MSYKSVLITGKNFSPKAIKLLRENGFKDVWEQEYVPEEKLIKLLSNTEVYLLAGNEYLSRKSLHSAPKLKLVIVLATGYTDFVDLEAANELNIRVLGMPGFSAQAVAEMTFALMLNAIRNISFLNASTKGGAWLDKPTNELFGKNIGIIGAGNIGTQVAQIARYGFNMNVVYYSHHRNEKIENDFQGLYHSLNDVIQESDVISLHVPLTNETRFLIGKGQFNLFKPTAILINTARAWLVDPKYLRLALLNRRLSMAAFDVYYKEPIPSPDEDEYGLLKLPDNKFLLTPHTAYLTYENFEGMSMAAAQIVLEI